MKKIKNKINFSTIRKIIISIVCIILALMFLFPFLTIFADDSSANSEITIRASVIDSPKFIDNNAFHLEIWNKTDKEITLFIKSSGLAHKTTFNLSKNREDEDSSSFYNKDGVSVIVVKPNIYKKDPMNLIYTFSNKDEKSFNYSFGINSGKDKNIQKLIDNSQLFESSTNSLKWNLYNVSKDSKNDKSKAVYESRSLKNISEYKIELKDIITEKKTEENKTESTDNSKNEKVNKTENTNNIEAKKEIKEEKNNSENTPKTNDVKTEEQKNDKGKIEEMINLVKNNKYAMIGAVTAGAAIAGGISYLIYRFHRNKEYVDIYNFEDKEYYED